MSDLTVISTSLLYPQDAVHQMQWSLIERMKYYFHKLINLSQDSPWFPFLPSPHQVHVLNNSLHLNVNMMGPYSYGPDTNQLILS